jgi:hypothetical protein
MARIDSDPSEGGIPAEAWFGGGSPAGEPDEMDFLAPAEDDAWVHARNRRRRARLRVIAALLVVLILFPIVITFVQRVLS